MYCVIPACDLRALAESRESKDLGTSTSLVVLRRIELAVMFSYEPLLKYYVGMNMAIFDVVQQEHTISGSFVFL